MHDDLGSQCTANNSQKMPISLYLTGKLIGISLQCNAVD